MSGFLRHLAMAFAAAGLIHTPVHAQQQQPDSIPRELGLALLAAFRIDAAAGLRTGRPPETFPANILPSGAVVLGSVDAPGAPMTVIRLPYWVAEATDSLSATLAAQGWRSADQPTPVRRGFVAASPDGRGGRGIQAGGGGRGGVPAPTLHCKGTETIRVTTASSAPASTVLAIYHSRNQSTPPCSGSERNSPLDDTPMPTLLAPTGATSRGGGSSGGNSSGFDARTEIVSAHTLAEIMRHYASQLVAAGWVIADSTANPGVATHSFTRVLPDNLGTWDLVLSGVLQRDQPVTSMYLWGTRRR